VLVKDVVARLKELGALGVTELSGIVEHVTFPLPKGLVGTVGTKAPEIGPAGS
jgi:4-hydroxy-3-methylbut-2-enyl diphosphate reductase